MSLLTKFVKFHFAEITFRFEEVPALLKDSKMAQGTIDSAAACAHEQGAACVRLGDFHGMEDSRVSFGPRT